MSLFCELIDKYDVAGPRYTSYPPVPFWEGPPSESEWISHTEKRFKEVDKREADFYFHIPFCKKLCFYCGCSRKISGDQNEGTVYTDYLLKEIEIYADKIKDFKTNSIHFGGGTPTFLKVRDISRIVETLFSKIPKVNNFAGSFEADPRITTKEQLETFNSFGLKRVSFGIQDMDEKVQKVIGRVQPVEIIRKQTELARKIGFNSINFDLIFGLPEQDIKSIERTFKEVGNLMPETIAFYSYAHVPHFAKNQKVLEKYIIPTGNEKRVLYERGRELLQKLGYIEIGMDHFVLPSSDLYKSYINRTMSRNFMGYTIQDAPVLLSLGVTSISNSGYSFSQNVKEIPEYYAILDQGKLPIKKGHVQTEMDLEIGKIVHGIMCLGTANFDDSFKDRLVEFEKDGLIKIQENSLEVLEKGRPFLRNISMAFDYRLDKLIKSGAKLPFSRTI
jgi:oxygen-independent coproporphyrinogen-3 oxidase